MILYLTLLLCALGAAVIVCRYDLYDREPRTLLAAAFVLGFGAMWMAGLVESMTFQTGQFVDAYAMAAVASLVEESMKALVVLVIAIVARRAFNDPMDGLVYGSMSGLGMAVEESIAYMSGTTGGGFFMPAEELVRVSGHMVMGGISGFAVGWAILRLRRWPVVLPGCFAAALTLHFGWDWIVLAFEHNPAPAPVLGSASLMLAGLAMYGSLAAIGSEKSRAIFAADGPSRLWGWPFRRSR